MCLAPLLMTNIAVRTQSLYEQELATLFTDSKLLSSYHGETYDPMIDP